MLPGGAAEEERLSALSALVRAQQADMMELKKTIGQQSEKLQTQSGTLASLRSSMLTAAEKEALVKTLAARPKAEQASPPKAAPKSGMGGGAAMAPPALVHIKFVFDADERLGKEVRRPAA